MSAALETERKHKAPPHAWKKGQSGNPLGRPRIVTEIRDLARQKTPQAIAALCAALKHKGERVPAASILLAYAYGRPEMKAAVRVIHDIADLSEEELRAIVERGDPDLLEAPATVDGEAEELQPEAE